jgi:nitrogen regulatory protein P-II 1
VLRLVTAVVRAHRVAAVREALAGIGVTGMTVGEAKGFGRQGGHSEVYRGTEYVIELVPKAKVDVLCSAEDADKVTEAIAAAARSGRIGDGKIWVTPLDEVVRIRTGDRGVEAL